MNTAAPIANGVATIADKKVTIKINMDGNHRFTPDSKEFNTVVKSKESSTGRNPYQTPPLEHNGTHHQTNYSRKKTNLAIIISNFLSEISRPLCWISKKSMPVSNQVLLSEIKCPSATMP